MKTLTIFILFSLYCTCDCNKTVCSTWSDYLINWGSNPNCWFNPDIYLTQEEIIRRRGYAFESYEVSTPDGFILGLFRIPYHTSQKTKKPGQPVFLHHGLWTSSMCFLDCGDKSLAFHLVNAGYDVWLTNARGTKYSSKNVLYEHTSSSYWNFTFHEIGIYDIVPQIDLISKITKKKGHIIYIGHSMGTTISYIYSIFHKQHAEENLKGLISLAPCAYLGNLQGSTISISARYAFSIKFIASQLFGMYHVGSIDGRSSFVNMCDPLYMACMSYAVRGKDLSQTPPEYAPIFLSHFPEAASLKTTLHFASIIQSGRFVDYDGSDYDLSQIELPVHLFYGKGDHLTVEADVLRLFESLTGAPYKSITSISTDGSVEFNHIDFICSKDIEKYLYAPLLKALMELG